MTIISGLDRQTELQIKQFLMNPLLPMNTKSNGNPKMADLRRRNSGKDWRDPNITDDVISQMYDHLIATGQIVVDSEGVAYFGEQIFEHHENVSEVAVDIVNFMIEDLSDRRGIKHEISAIPNDVMDELKNTWAIRIDQIIAKSMETT